MRLLSVIFLGLVAVSVKSSNYEQLQPKVYDVLTYQDLSGSYGKHILLDLWAKDAGLQKTFRYNADITNTYHLFTRENPTVSQLMVLYNKEQLKNTYYNSKRRTIVLIHGWLGSATAAINTVLVPAFLEAEDVNVIVVDWSHGAGTVAYPMTVLKTSISGASVAKFISWLNKVSGSELANYHIVGHNLGAHQAGIVGRHLGGKVAYITGLDPAFSGWVTNDDKFKATDAVYTEVIHTNAGLLGYLAPLADSDFYPNGGIDMPGCLTQDCDSDRSFRYFGESIKRGGFTGTRCFTFESAMAGQCYISGSLNMGGIAPKTEVAGGNRHVLESKIQRHVTSTNPQWARVDYGPLPLTERRPVSQQWEHYVFCVAGDNLASFIFAQTFSLRSPEDEWVNPL